MKIRGMAYDSQGMPGVTTQAYEAFRRWRKAGKTRVIGKVGGREVWPIIPTKGATGLNAPRLIITYPDTGRKSNRDAGRGEVPTAQFNPNLFKDDLAAHLKAAMPGPWYVHFPAELKSRAAPHSWFEQLVSERQLPNGRWEKVASHAKNEALDLMVLAHIVAHLHGLSRIDWANPPAWAADWDNNSGVFNPAEVLAAAQAKSIPPPAPGPSPTSWPADRARRARLLNGASDERPRLRQLHQAVRNRPRGLSAAVPRPAARQDVSHFACSRSSPPDDFCHVYFQADAAAMKANREGLAAQQRLAGLVAGDAGSRRRGRRGAPGRLEAILSTRRPTWPRSRGAEAP
jgi:hypothetical protein